MNILIIIKQGPLLNQTLSTIKFDQFGRTTDRNYIICDTWIIGFMKAKNLGYDYGLFIDSGTVFSNLDKFIEDLSKYPQQGLVGHIINPKQIDQFFYLNEQAFFLELSKFDENDFQITDFQSPDINASQHNIHDDYTPLWINAKDSLVINWLGQRFGEKLIARQLQRGPVVNFNNVFRDNKKFLYNNEEYNNWINAQSDYLQIAESQLWVFNNENTPLSELPTIVLPASGLCWIKNAINPKVTNIELVDISKIQLTLAEELWNNWDGDDYGWFVADFIFRHSVKHFNLDQPSMSDLLRLKLRNRKFFAEFVNEIFARYIDKDKFNQQWMSAKDIKTIKFNNSDMIKFLPNYVDNTQVEFNLWVSNILEYKYTMIKNTQKDYNRFNTALNNPKVKKIYG